MARTTDLGVAFLATTYRIFLPGGGCELRPGVASETLRCWLETAGANEFAILTAHNPDAQPADEQDNAMRQSQLECDLLAAGFEPYAGENVALDADWPNEETCFVPAISRAEALAFARKYRQKAIICGGKDGLPLLAWVDENPVDGLAA